MINKSLNDPNPAKVEVHFFDNTDNYARGYEWYKEQVGTQQLGTKKSGMLIVSVS